MSRLFLFVFFLFFASFAYANANSSVTTGYNRANLISQIKRAIKSPKSPIPSTLIGLGVTGIIEGIEKIQKDMENPNFIDEKAKEHISHTDTQTTHGGASGGGGAIGYDYIYRGVAYSSPEQVRALMLKQIEENGWKLSRQKDGHYYQHWVVNMQDKTMRLYAQVAQKNDPVCAKLNNRCGWHTWFSGDIVPIGDINNKTFYNTKEQARDIALDRVINDLIDKHEEELKTAIPTGVGTGVGTGTGVDAGVGTNTGSQEATDEATQVQPRPIPTDTPKPFELPEFCKWSSWFCEGNIDKKDTDIDIDEMPIPANSVNISFGGSCPTPQNFSFSIGGRSMVFSMSFDSLCRIATSFGGIVKIISTIIAAYILTGIKS